MNTKTKVGRKATVINWPNKKFTFVDLKQSNPDVTPLTLRKALGNKRNVKTDADITVVKGERRDSDSDKGLGRKTLVYARKTLLTAINKAKRTVKMKMNEPKTVAVAPVVPVAEVPMEQAA